MWARARDPGPQGAGAAGAVEEVVARQIDRSASQRGPKVPRQCSSPGGPIPRPPVRQAPWAPKAGFVVLKQGAAPWAPKAGFVGSPAGAAPKVPGLVAAARPRGPRAPTVAAPEGPTPGRHGCQGPGSSRRCRAPRRSLPLLPRRRGPPRSGRSPRLRPTGLLPPPPDRDNGHGRVSRPPRATDPVPGP